MKELCESVAKEVKGGTGSEYDIEDLTHDLYVYFLERQMTPDDYFARRDLLQEGYRIVRGHRGAKWSRPRALQLVRQDFAAVEQMVADGAYPPHYRDALQQLLDGDIPQSDDVVNRALTRLQEIYRTEFVSLDAPNDNGHLDTDDPDAAPLIEKVTYDIGLPSGCGSWEYRSGWESTAAITAARPYFISVMNDYLSVAQREYVGLWFYLDWSRKEVSTYLGHDPSVDRQRALAVLKPLLRHFVTGERCDCPTTRVPQRVLPKCRRGDPTPRIPGSRDWIRNGRPSAPQDPSRSPTS